MKIKIKSSLLILSLFQICDLQTNAQNLHKVNYTIKFGSIYPFVYENPSHQYSGGHDSYTAKFKSCFGLYLSTDLEIQLRNHYSASWGISYIKNKYSIERTQFIVGSIWSLDKGSIESSYLSSPIFVNYKFSKNFPLIISLGTYLSILLKSEDKGKSLNFYFYPNKYEEYNNDIGRHATFIYKKLDVGFGFQSKYVVKNFIVIFSEFRTGIIDSKKKTQQDDSKWFNLNLIFGLGIKL